MVNESWLMQELVENSDRAIFVINLANQLIYINRAGENLTGENRSRLAGLDFHSILASHMGMAPQNNLVRAINRCVGDGAEQPGVPVVAELGAEKKWLQAGVRCLRDPEGQQYGCVITLSDVTRLQQMEIQMSRAEALASAGQIAAGVAHEVKNPLSAVRGFAQLISARSENEQIRRYADYMVEEIDKAIQIIHDFLRLARPPAPSFRLTQIEEVLEEVVTLVETEAHFRGIRLVRKYSNPPPLMLDQTRIRQVFLNILANAIGATPRGGQITVAAGLNDGLDQVWVDIQDTGTGMTPDVLARIGQPFFTTKENGTGLGLSLSYKMIQDHGGQVLVHSEPGMGSSFKVFLPLNNK